MTVEQAFAEVLRAMERSGGHSSGGCRISIGTVREIDEKEGTCLVARDGSPDMHDVRLNAVIDQTITDRFVVIPQVGSFVLVLSLGEDTEGLVIAMSKIERVSIQTEETSLNISSDGVVMNGGGLGGLIDIARLTEKVNALVDAFNEHTHTIPSGGIATQGSATAQATTTPVTVPAIQTKADRLDKTDYEDEKVKH